MSAQEKHKQLKNGDTATYIYYGCSRARDTHCKNRYMREDHLINQLLEIIDEIDIHELGMKQTLTEEVKRFSRFQSMVLGKKVKKETVDDVDVRMYAKYLLKEGTQVEKRNLLSNLKSKLVCKNKQLQLASLPL